MQEFEAHFRKSPLVESELSSHFVRDVKFTPARIRAPIVDSYHFAAVIARIDDPHDGPQRQGRVSGRCSVHVIVLPGRCGEAVKVFSVPAGSALPDSQGFALGCWTGAAVLER